MQSEVFRLEGCPMHTKRLVVICGLTIFLAGCQPSAPASAVPVADTPSSAPQETPTPLPTLQPTPTQTVAPTQLGGAVTPVNINAFCTSIGKPVTTRVAAGSPVNIVWGWSATTEKFVEDFLQYNLTVVTLDGQVIEGKMVEGILHNQTSGEPEVVWVAEVGVLPPGSHMITYDLSFTQVVDDGHTTYGPGTNYKTGHDQCEILVEDTAPGTGPG